MKGLVQRVKSASVSAEQKLISSISSGTLLLLGIEKNDTLENAYKLADKVAKIRIFSDDEGKMNKSLLDIQGQLLVVSQFTLAADTKKGNRPGFSNAASGAHAEELYLQWIEYYRSHYGECQTGVFGGDMQVSLINDGPATFLLQT